MFKVFQASSADVEVDGKTVVAVTSGILVRAVANEMLASAGLRDVRHDSWYPQQPWLGVYRSIHEHLGPDTLYSIGRRIPYAADFPAEQMRDVGSALAAIDVAYHMAHRGGEIGHYRFVEAGLDHYEVHCDNPYPNEFNLGIIASLVERFRGRHQYEVRYQKPASNPAEDNACIIEVVRT